MSKYERLEGLDTFTMGYLSCALFSTNDEEEDPLDHRFGPMDFSEKSLQLAIADCKLFQEQNADQLALYYRHYDQDYAGHDFWLTRNHHGAGFWDRVPDGPELQQLTDKAHEFKELDIVVNSDSGELEFEG